MTSATRRTGVNVFVVPGWYPSATTPLSGIFVREQVAAIASVFPEHRLMVSTWGHDDAELTFRDPARLMRSLRWRLRAFGGDERAVDGYHEVFHPALTWSPRLPWGGATRTVQANARNLAQAQRHFGRFTSSTRT